MFTCADRHTRNFFKSRIKDPAKRTSQIVDFLRREPWRQILKKELAYDSEDENCTIIKTFLQDENSSGRTEDGYPSESECVTSRLECWHKLKELTKYVPELRCILNDVNYAPSDERETHDGEPALDDDKTKPTDTNEVESPETKAARSLKSKVKSLHEVLYSNKDFAKVLDGIVHKEILELINFDEKIEKHNFSMGKKRSRITFIDMALLSKSPELEEDTPTEDVEVLFSAEEKTKEVRKTADIDESEQATRPTLDEEQQAESSPEKSKADDDEQEQAIVEEKHEEKQVSSEELEDSDEFSDPDELLNELLGAMNYQDILEEWKITKADLESKIIEKKQAEMKKS